MVCAGENLTANLRLNQKKCSFLCKFVRYLGFIISREGLAPDPSNIGVASGTAGPVLAGPLLARDHTHNYFHAFR